MSRTLTLRVTRQWFDEIEAGIKTEEYRETTEYWIKRLTEPTVHPIFENRKPKEFDQIEIVWGYKPNRETKWHLFFPWRGFEIKTITHPHFQNIPKRVFAIKLEKP